MVWFLFVVYRMHRNNLATVRLTPAVFKRQLQLYKACLYHSRYMIPLLLTFFAVPVFALAQNFHLSLRAGRVGYVGELKSKTFGLEQMRSMSSIGVRYDITPRIQARGYFSYGFLQAKDSLGTPDMQIRNLSFETELFDFELGAQYNFINLSRWTPYAFAGLGLFHFDPYTYHGKYGKLYLQPLSTEGQGVLPGTEEYKLTQISVPLGFGLDYDLSLSSKLGIELGYRKTFTDYIDDVSTNYADRMQLLEARGVEAVDVAYRADDRASGLYPAAGTQRGNPKTKDGYYYFGLTWTFSPQFISGGSRITRRKPLECPVIKP
jgi:hypothetical protein